MSPAPLRLPRCLVPRGPLRADGFRSSDAISHLRDVLGDLVKFFVLLLDH
jgi:hypothetical protein